jgi:putative ABC transport system substrate-binding protein
MRLNSSELIVMLALGIFAASLAAEAQPAGKVYRIGVLERTSMALNAANLAAFRHGMRELGYVEGQNLVIEYRYTEGSDDRSADLATELVRLEVDLILTRGTPATLVAKKAAGTIP